jgi:hypothetical protein
MEIMILVAALLALGVLALLFGADSRKGIGDEPRIFGLLR